MRNIKNLLLLFLFLHFKTNYAQPPKYLFQHIEVEEGLTDNSITTFHRDCNGVMWVGTRNGLNRLIGSQIEQLKHTSDSSSLGCNYVRRIYEDQEKNIWVLTALGVSKYISQKNQFINYEIPTITRPKYVAGMCEDQHNDLWIFRYNGDILRKKHKHNHFKKVPIKNKKLQFNHIKHTLQLGQNIIICSEYGIFILDLSTKKIINDCPILNKYNINSIIKSSNEENYWIATENHGVIKTDSQFNHIDSITTILPNKRVRTIGIDNNKKLWIGTTKGLVIYNTINKQYHRIEENNINPYALSQNSIHSILIDSKLNQVWIGTLFGGISLYKKNKIPFYTINPWISFHGIKTKGRIVNTIAKDSQQRLWIGTADAGVNIWDRKKNTIRAIKKSKGLSSNHIKTIKIVNDSIALIGTHSKGLNIYNYKSEKITSLKSSVNNQLKDDHIYDILLDHKHRIWIGTWNGLFQFNLEQKKFTPYHYDCQGKELSSKQISCLYQDVQKLIWIGTYRGLNIYDPQKQQFYHFTTEKENGNLSNNNITTIHQDQTKHIWVGTHAGINLYEPSIKSFIIPEELKKYKTSTIYSIKSDQDNNLWFSSTEGIIFYNTTSKELIQYNKKDGVLNSLFRKNCVIETKDKELIFGGNNGLTLFHPSFRKCNNKSISNPIFIRKVVGMNKDKSDSIIYHNPSQQSTLEFSTDYNNIKIYYDNIDSQQKYKTKFQYQLEGRDKSWSSPSTTKVCYFKNLDSYHYVFKIKDTETISSLHSIKFTINKDHSFIKGYLILMFILILTSSIIFKSKHSITKYFKRYKQRFKKKETLNVKKINQQVQALEFCVDTLGRKCKRYQTIKEDHQQLKQQVTQLRSTLDSIKGQKQEESTTKNDIEYNPNKHTNLTILLVCDNTTLRASYSQNLREYFNIKECSTMQVVESILLKNKIEAIVFYPVHTIHSDNINFCKQIKQNIKLFPIPLLYINNVKEEQLEVELLKKGVDDIVSIPFTSALLHEKILNHSRRNSRLTDIFTSSNTTKNKNTPITKEHIFLKHITKIVESNYYKNDFTVDKFALLTKMSRSNLHIKIKNITGSTTSNFIMKYRMQKAVELIQKEQLTIVEISEKVGFNNANYFSKNFKKEFGIAPSEYLTTKNRYSN